eukprot:3828284-Pyramimonas_sp.AAC.1
MHVALKLEKASNQRQTPVSRAARRCLAKLRMDGFGRTIYHRAGQGKSSPSKVKSRMTAMVASKRRQLYDRIHKDMYAN